MSGSVHRCEECGSNRFSDDGPCPFCISLEKYEGDMREIYKCKYCGWKRPLREASFGQNEFACPKCLKEGGLEPTGEMVYSQEEDKRLLDEEKMLEARKHAQDMNTEKRETL